MNEQITQKVREALAAAQREAAERNHISGGGPETDGCRIWFADQCEYLRRERQRTAPDCQLKGEYQEKNIQTAPARRRMTRKGENTPRFGRGIPCDDSS